MKTNIKKLPKSEVEIEGELESDVFEGYFAKAVKKLSENLEVDGFRKGKIPDNILLSKIPEIKILEEMAELALSEHYPKILEAEKIDAISRPEISITKLARNNPLGFKIKTAVLPEIKLGDYKKLAKKVLSEITEKDKDTTVTEEDLETTIMDIRKSRAPRKHIKDGARMAEGTEEVKEELPELDDNFVKGLGPFTDVADFREKLKENIKLEKENQVKEKTRLKIIDQILEETEIDTPEVLINLETDKILYRMESDISQMGIKFEEYLKHLKKTVEDLRKEFQKDAEKKAKLSLILNEIAKLEKITPDETEVEKEVSHLLSMYKEADPERARAHVESVLINEKIFQFLETQ
jgi:FKBP-type peptidyl-prolyl cis-trans isomerase (trigger factor)